MTSSNQDDNDQQADKEIFLQHKNNLIHELSNKALDSDQCNAIGKKYFKNSWGGCLPWNQVHVRPNKYYVVNTSSSGDKSHYHPGIHWMGLVTVGKHAYLWDSYNRSIKRMLPHLVRKMIKHRFKLEDTHHPMDQIGHTSEVCGQNSLAWLMTVKDIGIQRAHNL